MNNFIKANVKLLMLSILSGIFIGTSFIPFPPWAALFCFAPLWLIWLEQSRLKPILISGWLTSFTLTLIGFNWMTYLFHEFAHMPWPIAFISMLLFAAVAHLFIPFAGFVWFMGRQKWQWSSSTSLAMMALIMAFCEYFYWTLFRWNFGYSWFASGLPIFQTAELIGFTGLSTLTVLTSWPLLIAWQKRKERSGKLIALSVAASFLALNGLGLYLKDRLPLPDKIVHPLIVQANIGNLKKQAAELGRGFRTEILNKYLRITKEGLDHFKDKKIDFALWPETAFPSLIGKEFLSDRLPRNLRRFQYENQLPMVIGAYSRDPTTQLTTNSLFALDKDGEFTGPHYSKSILLAFGEYIPGETLFPKIRSWLPPIGHFSPGPGPNMTLKQDELKIGPQICYESLFPGFSRSLANLGAQLIVNVTNDSWYGSWQEPYQHMYMTLARAVEFRRPVIRVTNTGISTVALASGEKLESSPLRQEWFGRYDVPYRESPPETFYQRWFWLVPFFLFGSLLLFFIRGLRERTKFN
ncbi:apolipoprotein N-acyltransferase [Bdellovibrionales bacterium]|nr:apolipoprotein N-acyltransferase [Bdellovibrionales bacterium]